MQEVDLANIAGSIGSKFVVTIDSGTILQATLHLPGSGTADTPLPYTDQSVTVNIPTGLPAGPSLIRLAIDFAPGEANAHIGVGAVSSGSATASKPPGVIYDDGLHSFAVITLFGA